MELSYKKAIEEMQDILHKIENEELDVDEISEKVERVSYLYAYCQKKLKTTQNNVERIIEQMQSGEYEMPQQQENDDTEQNSED